MELAVAQLSQETPALQVHKLKFLPALQDILKSYEFRSPITLAYESSVRLNCGFPVDLIKVQNPLKKKIPQLAPSGTELARPHKLHPHIICESGRMYMPTSKHMPLKNGEALGGPDASVNPIPSYTK